MIQNSSSSSTSGGGGGGTTNNEMEIENMHPFCLPFSLCHDATSSSLALDDNNSLAIEGQIGPDETRTAAGFGQAQDEFDVFDLEIRIEDELDHEFKLQFEQEPDKRNEGWFHMSDHFHLLSPPAPISTDIKSSPTLAQLNLNSTEDPVDALWDHHTTTTPTSATTLGRATPRSSATTTTSTLISPSVQRHRSIQNQHHHLSALSPVSSDLLGSNSSHAFNLYQRPNTHQGHHFHQDQFSGQQPAAALARPILQRCQSPAPLVTSSCSPLSTAGANENKLKENIDYLTVLLCNGSKKLDSKTANGQHQQAPPQQQSGISSSMAKSYSTLAQSLSTGPKLLERYQVEGPPQQVEPRGLKPGAQFVQGTSNFEKVDSSVSAADSTGEAHHLHHHQQQQHHHHHQHQLAAAQTANQAYTFCYSNANQPLDSRASEMKVLSSLLSSGKTLAGPIYGPTMMSTAMVDQSAAWPTSAAATATFQPAIGQQIPIRPIEGALGYPHDPSAVCLQSPQLYNQQVSSSIPVNGRPITLTPLVSNNVNIPSRPTPPPASAQAPVLAAKGRAPAFIQPASPSTSSTTSSSGTTDTSTQSSTASKRQRPAAGQTTTAAASGAASKQQASDRSGRPSSMSTDGSLSSHDEGFASQVDQDDCADSVRDSDDDASDLDSDDESFYGDYTNNDLIGASISDNPDCKWTLNMGRTRRNGQRRFFWQYNVQSKGPKGARVCSAEGGENPFVLPEASDPVFSDECQIEGVKHSGKARRGDGNDLTPNPRKLLMIGLELKKLSKIINELAPVTDLPVNARNKTRKEKNKLASRACRLKKKAQHEANKIKLYGLQREHQQVVMAIFDARKIIHRSLATTNTTNDMDAGNQMKLSSTLRRLLDQCIITVAGQTGDYVNSVLEKVVSGCIDGGLQT